MKARQGGFTLIELLIAMAVSAVIAVLAYQAIAVAVTSYEVQRQQQQQLAQLQRVLGWLEQDVMQMAPRAVLDNWGSVLPAFSLLNGRMEFTRIALYPTPYAAGGLLRVAYYIEEDNLIRETWPVLDRAPDTQGQRQRLLMSVSDLTLRVRDAQGEWVSDWPRDATQTALLPTSVEWALSSQQFGALRRIFNGPQAFVDE
ncbi:MAG: type II secretion system minor pseudopilin GspJ [Thiomicrospira sp.]